MHIVSSSTSTLGKENYMLDKYRGTYKVTYHPSEDWDFDFDTASENVDFSLVLPHYRARNQPVDHRMSIFVGSESGSIKLKVCRHVPRSKFYLQVQAKSDVTVWLPSDFRGRIYHSGKAAFSSGFVNRIDRNTLINPNADDTWVGDEVVVNTKGSVAFRMWDVHTGAPENPRKERFKRIFGCTNKADEIAIDWDFLLEE